MGDRDTSAEAELVERVAGRSEEALSRLYDRYGRLLYSLIVAILGNPGDAEEVLQETFLQLWRDAARFDPRRGSVYRWLVTIARSRAIDRYRSKGFKGRRDVETHLEEAALRAADAQPSPLESAVRAQRAGVVRSVLAGMPPEQRRLMHLAYFLGYSQSEIARLLEIPLGTVKTRMRQALLTLQRLVGQEPVS